MPKNQISSSIAVSKSIFIFLRIFPLVITFILSYFRIPIIVSFLLISVSCSIDLFFTKEQFGLGLVGLRYYRNKSEAPNFPNFVYYSKPLPFVASTIDSNVFWLGLIISPIGWAISSVFNLFLFGFGWFLISFIACLLNLLNFSAFMKCHNAGKEQADSIARTLLLDTNVTFKAAKEEDELSPDTEESVNEDEKENDIEIEEEEEEKTTTVLEA